MCDIVTSKTAFDHFTDSKFDQAANLLDGLKTEHFKITHNVLLANYFGGNITAEELKIELSKLFKKQKSVAESHVLLYNTALSMIRYEEYHHARIVLECGFRDLELVDDYIAIKISFLLVEVYLRFKMVDQALGVLAYLEKPFVFITVLGRKTDIPTFSPDLDFDDDETENFKERNFDDGPKPKTKERGWTPSINIGNAIKEHNRAPDTLSLTEYKFYISLQDTDAHTSPARERGRRSSNRLPPHI